MKNSHAFCHCSFFKKIIILSLAIFLFLPACSKPKTDPSKSLTLQFKNMPQLATGFFALWLKNGTHYERLRQFLVSEDGAQTDIRRKNNLEDKIVLKNSLFDYEKILVTIEPLKYFNTDYNPSKSALLSALIIPGEPINLTYQDLNLGNISGKYYLHNYSDPKPLTLTSGLWFADLQNSQPVKGLNLPPAIDGWIYEGWIKKDGQYLSMGQFGSGVESDLNYDYSAGKPTISFPGEDFLYNAPAGFSFPLVLNDGETEAIISLEPYLSVADSFKEKTPSMPILSAEIRKDMAADSMQVMNLVKNALPEAKIEIE